MSVPSGVSLRVRRPGEVALDEVTPRDMGAQDVLIVPIAVGLCGTDLELIDGAMDPAYVRYPLVLGHEWAGRVAATGGGVTRVAVGDHVVGEGIAPDGVCAACREGRTNLCERYDELGFTLDGAAGPHLVMPEHLVHRLAPEVPVEAGALVEPMAVVMHGLLAADPPPGRRVAVIGDGAIALLAAHLIRLWSPRAVTVVGRRAAQASLAMTLGADDFSLTDVPAGSHDYVIEAAGSPDAITAALAAARRGGAVTIFGISGTGNFASVSGDDIVNNELCVRGSFGYTAKAWRLVVDMLNRGALEPLPLVTHRFSLVEYERAIRTLRSPRQDEPRGKVLLMPSVASDPEPAVQVPG